MLLEEAQARLKKEKITTQGQLWAINSLYILLDLEKDDFCKIIDAVGLEKLIKKQAHYDRLERAENEYRAKENYVRAQSRIEELEEELASFTRSCRDIQDEIKELERVVNRYKPIPTA